MITRKHTLFTITHRVSMALAILIAILLIAPQPITARTNPKTAPNTVPGKRVGAVTKSGGEATDEIPGIPANPQDNAPTFDGNIDAVFANWDGENRVCLGNGVGGFSACSDVSTDTNYSTAVALADLNGDAYPDAVFANRHQANRVCLGDGAGGFSTCSDVSADTNRSWGVALADLNGDAYPNTTGKRLQVALV
ncbi:MAG: FG-GAP repeat domain-containing protein [Anaerolineales bacterium]